MDGNIVDVVKKIGAKTKSFVNTLIKMFKFVVTPLGQIIGVAVLVVVLVALVYVASKVLKHTLGIFGNNEYAGISTEEDYETIVGSLGYSGYDSFISEELWQEYLAFEYAVLMDVAEHMYENQDYVTELDDPNGGKYTTSAVIPEGIVNGEYDAGAITKQEWQQYVVDGQGGGAPESFDTGTITYVGGNREVTTPRIIYEIADHEYENEALSLMPYLVVVREDIELNYFIEGLSKEVWDYYEDKNLQPIEIGHLQEAQSKLEPVRFSAELNRYNYNMPSSGYKKDLEDDQEGELVVGVEDKEGFLDADRAEGYGDSIYYIEQETDIVYKIPLRILINRYLPKSILLTSWYMLKPDDVNDNGFKVEEMMEDIKAIYNAACYNNGLNVPEIKITGEIDSETGKIGGVGADAPSTLRNVPESSFNADGSAESNLRTFIYFEQFGLETSRYEQYVAYRGPSGDNKPYAPDEARPEAISPSATYLTRDKVNFIKQLNLTLGEITYLEKSGDEEVEVTIDSLDVRLKPTYILDVGLDEGEDGELIDEKLKNNYNFENNKLNIEQEEPYEFMKAVRNVAETLIGNWNISSYSGEEAIYEHEFRNQYYMIAEIGNTDKMDPIIERDGKIGYSTKDAEYRLAEDYRYYNQDDLMPQWYDFKTHPEQQEIVEEKYLKAFLKLYKDDGYEELIKIMLAEELGLSGPDKIISFEKDAEYTVDQSAKLYNGDEHVLKEDAIKAKDGEECRINYYWDAVYVIEEKELQMRQKIHHRRMPVALVKYADTWAKSIEYENTITQNSLDYRDYRYLIPSAKTSLGLKSMELVENPKYRVDTYKDYFNKVEDTEATGLKEADVLEMLIQWEDLGDQRK